MFHLLMSLFIHSLTTIEILGYGLKTVKEPPTQKDLILEHRIRPGHILLWRFSDEELLRPERGFADTVYRYIVCLFSCLGLFGGLKDVCCWIA